jgi:hypothetical protein
MQLIGAGFGRTGTLSLKIALEMLGFGPCYHMIEVFNKEKNPTHLDLWDAVGRGEQIDWQELFKDYRATVDWPAATFYQELMACYPEAKALLSVRDPEKWYQSAMDTIYTFGKPPDTQFANMVDNIIWEGTFGGRFPDKAAAMEIFQQHIAQVQQQVPPEAHRPGATAGAPGAPIGLSSARGLGTPLCFPRSTDPRPAFPTGERYGIF